MSGGDSNRLPILIEEIRSAHQAAIGAARTAVDKARLAGHALNEVKELLQHGAWLPWLRSTGVSPRTAQGYMALARFPDDKYATVAHFGIRRALAEIAKSAFRLPTPGRATIGRSDRAWAAIWPAVEYPGFFFTFDITDDPAVHLNAGTIARPVRGDFVRQQLAHFPIGDADWTIVAHAGELDRLRAEHLSREAA